MAQPKQREEKSTSRRRPPGGAPGTPRRRHCRFCRDKVKAGPTGSLFGSVTPTDLADELWKVAKIRVDRRKIDLAEPIKKVGRYSVPVELFTDVTVEVSTLVVPEGGELPPEEPDEVAETEEPVAEAAAEPIEEAAEAPVEAPAEEIEPTS